MTLFSVAMAFLESAIVIYLRELYYPQGFGFPLAALPGKIALTEFLREAATLVMLLAAGYLAGRQADRWFAWSVYGFAIWDIFYYAYLKILLDWPETWLTWDILFLIPVIWTGPVIAPILVSLTMILLSGVVLYFSHRYGNTVNSKPAFICLISGSVLIFLAFIWDFCAFLNCQTSPITSLHDGIAADVLRNYVPRSFNWALFLTGETCIATGIVLLILKNLKHKT
jgi:hypothetical protein